MDARSNPASNLRKPVPLTLAVLRLSSPVLVSLVAMAAACGSSTPDNGSSSGGAPSTSGGSGGVITGSGGAPSSGGSTSGGAPTTNGGSTPLSSGGANVAGSSGGSVSPGAGAGAGGVPATTGGAGGAPVVGGTSSSSSGGTGGGTSTGGATTTTAKFSFFVTSQVAIVAVSKSDKGFGGDLTFGETGPGAGLRGADKICAAVAERGMAGAGQKPWRAFLSVTDDGTGKPMHAIDRVGNGPWYDRKGRLVAMTKADLLTTRPTGADPQIVNDLPNEDGVPNHAPNGSMQVDNHDILTGTNEQGQLFSMTATCKDWTSSDGATGGRPRVGHSWPRAGFGGGKGGGFAGGTGFPGGSAGNTGIGGIGDTNNWMSALDEAGCGKGFNIVEMGPPNPNDPTVGSGGGYGGIYCFSLTP